MEVGVDEAPITATLDGRLSRRSAVWE